MPGRAKAISAGGKLETEVEMVAKDLNLDVAKQFKCGRRIWGAERRIDIVITQTVSRKRLGIECKAQDSKGTAEEKVVATIQDIGAWPIPGLVVFSGSGFSEKMKSYMIASGKAVSLEDLEGWLRLFFGLDLQ